MNLNPHNRVIETLAQLIPLRSYYVSKGIPLNRLYESVYDLSYRLERYYQSHADYGLSDRDVRWLSPLYKAKIFDLGSLRFEISGFYTKEIERSGYDYMPLIPGSKDLLPEGTAILTIHILKDTDFRPDKIDESFDKAVHFFDAYFPDHNYHAFICRTWLLYGQTRELLGKNSNIISFSKRFKIIADNKNTKQALDRIYGASELDVIKQKDKRSSLEKVAYKNLDKLGVAAGVIFK